MNKLFFIVIFETLTIVSFGQDTSDGFPGMTPDQNIDWLVTVKNADKRQQLTLIQTRFFGQTPLKWTGNGDMPILIVDGFPISDGIKSKTIDFLVNEMTPDKVEIKILDKEPEGLYVNKRFTGIVLMTIVDKRTSKKFKRLV